jgi:hypothetical protein
MSTELVETINGIGGWVGMILGILYIYNQNSPLGMNDVLFILSSPVMSAASLNMLFFGTRRLLEFVFNVYATMLHQDVQITAAFLLFSSSLFSAMAYTIHNLDKMRLNNVVQDENTEVDDEGEAVDEEDVDVVYDNDDGEVIDDNTTDEEDVVYEDDEGEATDDETEEATDDETEETTDNETENNYADDEADDTNVHKEMNDKIGLTLISIYRKMYGTMFKTD